MTERDHFLKAILADPANDEIRLIFADWLQERGEGDRAAFVRCQIGLDRFEDKHNCADYDVSCYVNGKQTCTKDEECLLHRLRQREGELLTKYKIAWLPPCILETTVTGAALVDDVAKTLSWHRGFVETVGCTLSEWLRWGPEMVLEAPIVRAYQLDRSPVFTLDSLGSGYTWIERPTPSPTPYDSDVPHVLYRRLKKNKAAGRPSYINPDRAHDDLAKAAANWARAEVGLPEVEDECFSPLKSSSSGSPRYATTTSARTVMSTAWPTPPSTCSSDSTSRTNGTPGVCSDCAT